MACDTERPCILDERKSKDLPIFFTTDRLLVVIIVIVLLCSAVLSRLVVLPAIIVSSISVPVLISSITIVIVLNVGSMAVRRFCLGVGCVMCWLTFYRLGF